MKIESIIKRAKGHSVELGGATYEFLPPDYLAEVENPDHIGRLLSITEGYRAFGASAASVPAPVKAESSTEILLGSDVHPSAFEINGKEYSLGDVVRLAYAASGLNAEAWNGLGEGERADLIDEQLDKLQADTNGDGEVDASEERATLAAEYEAKFGKKPHHKWKAEKIREELAKPAGE